MSDKAMMATLIGATLYGLPGVSRTVHRLATLDRLRVSVQALGGSTEEGDWVVKDAEGRWQAGWPSIEDACHDALWSWYRSVRDWRPTGDEE